MYFCLRCIPVMTGRRKIMCHNETYGKISDRVRECSREHDGCSTFATIDGQ